MGRDISLVSLTMAFVLGILTTELIKLNLSLLLVVILIILSVSLLLFSKYPQKAGIYLILIFFTIGIVRSAQDGTVAVNDISNMVNSHATVMGKIVEAPRIYDEEKNRKIRYIVETEQAKKGKHLTASSGKIMLSVSQDKGCIVGKYGDKITIKGEVLALHSYNNPGAVDMVAGWKRQGITARMSVKGEQIHLKPTGDYNLETMLIKLRADWVELFCSVLSPDKAAILNGVLFGGGYDKIPIEVLRAFSTTGIIHILSVSGSHISLLTIVMLWIGDRLRINAWGKIVLAGVSMLFYAILAGISPPVVRAVIMGMIALTALLSGRDKHGPSSLAVAVIAMLVYTPSLVYDISFQLSVSGTAGLIFLYRKIEESITFLPKILSSGIAVTVAAQAGMLPFLAWYFNFISLGSIIANLLVVPIIELIIIIGLAVCIISVISTSIAKIILFVCGNLIDLAVFINMIVASIRWLKFYIPSFTPIAALFYYFILAWVAQYIPAFPSLKMLHDKHTKAVCFSVLTIGIITILWIWIPRPVEVHFIDVGQGDATLVITPHRRGILFDTGGMVGENKFDIGERVIAPYLRHQGITEVDFLFLTHGHSDHAGGAAGLATVMPVNNIIAAPETPSLSMKKLISVQERGVIVPANTGQQVTLDGVSITTVFDGEESSKLKSGNETSCVYRIEYGAHSFLITGDLPQIQEGSIIAKGLKRCDVLKVAHHGSKTSTGEDFLRSVKPTYAVISVGFKNNFGHPHVETLNKLNKIGAKIFRTDKNGAVIFYTDGKVLTSTLFIP